MPAVYIGNIAADDQRRVRAELCETVCHPLAQITLALRQPPDAGRIQPVAVQRVVRRDSDPCCPAAPGGQAPCNRVQGRFVKPERFDRPDIGGKTGFNPAQLRAAGEDNDMFHR